MKKIFAFLFIVALVQACDDTPNHGATMTDTGTNNIARPSTGANADSLHRMGFDTAGRQPDMQKHP